MKRRCGRPTGWCSPPTPTGRARPSHGTLPRSSRCGGRPPQGPGGGATASLFPLLAARPGGGLLARHGGSAMRSEAQASCLFPPPALHTRLQDGGVRGGPGNERALIARRRDAWRCDAARGVVCVRAPQKAGVLRQKQVQRVTFTDITREAVLKAMQRPRQVRTRGGEAVRVELYIWWSHLLQADDHITNRISAHAARGRCLTGLDRHIGTPSHPNAHTGGEVKRRARAAPSHLG